MPRLLFSALICSVLELCLARTAHAQPRYYEVWHARDSLGLSFEDDSARLHRLSPFDVPSVVEGMASICDSATGALLFYSNGETVWNRNHRVMPGGAGLNGGISQSLLSFRLTDGMNRGDTILMPGSHQGQGPLIVPYPGDSLRYFIFYFVPVGPFTSTAPAIPASYNLAYAVVDMREDGGLGDVVEKNTLLLRNASSKLTAVRYGNGGAFWVVTHEQGTDRFLSWLITELGVSSSPVVSQVGTAYTDYPDHGTLEASPDGSMLFACHSLGFYYPSVGDVTFFPVDKGSLTGELFGFDHCSGVVGPLIERIPAGFGSSFSANNRFLYTSVRDSIFQFDLQSPGGDILATRELLNSPGDVSYFYGMQRGPDGNVYVLNAPSFVELRMGIVENANLRYFGGPGGANYYTIGYSRNNRKLPVHQVPWGHRIGLPNCIEGYLGETPVVDPVDVTLAIDGDTILCRGEGLPMRVRGALRYEWTPADGLTCPDCPDLVAWPQRTTTYRVIGYRYRPCPEVPGIRKPIDTVWITLEVREPPTADAGADTAMCAGESVGLKGSGVDPTTGTYQWSPAEGLSCTDCPEPVAAPQSTTTYRLTVTSENGCTDVDSVQVKVYPRDARITASDTVICRGERVTLRATGGKDYAWSPAEGLDCLDCPAPVATPEKTTTYVVRTSTEGNCPDFDSVTIVVHEPAAVDAGNDTVICVGESVRLKATGGLSYSWTSGAWLDCDTCAEPVARPVSTTTFRVWITNENGCSAWDSVTVTVESKGGLSVDGDTTFCPGGVAFLSAKGADTFEWRPATGLSCVDCPNPTASPGETTVYYVIGRSAGGGCAALDSVIVTVSPAPVADAGNDTAICDGGSVRLTASGGERYRWDPTPDLSCTDCVDPVATPSAAALYYVTVTDANGCTARDSVRVDIHPPFVVSAGDDLSLCIGDSVRLRASGGVAWRWEPAEGLSCIDCPDPLASPSRTLNYRVTAWNAEGCAATDEVLVNVRVFPEVIRARIPRDYKGFPGSPVVVHIELPDPVTNSDIGDLFLELDYDPGVMIFDPASIERQLAGTLLEGWSVSLIEVKNGRAVLRLTAPTGVVLGGRGTLLSFEGRFYLGNRQGTELPFRLSTTSNCFVFESDTGYVRLDSVCGLSLRLIEASAQKYADPAALPNPARNLVRFAFGLGLDGDTRMEVFDGAGRRVALVVNEHLPAGAYEAEWEVGPLPAGLYLYRLTSGDWSRTGQMMIVE